MLSITEELVIPNALIHLEFDPIYNVSFITETA